MRDSYLTNCLIVSPKRGLVRLPGIYFAVAISLIDIIGIEVFVEAINTQLFKELLFCSPHLSVCQEYYYLNFIFFFYIDFLLIKEVIPK